VTAEGCKGLLTGLRRGQRIGLFIGALIAVLALLAHNPLNGYVTEVTWANPPGPQCPHRTLQELQTMTQAEVDHDLALTRQYCGTTESRDLDFSLWRSAEPMILWFG
jgi:hypothetical protein